MELMHEVGIKFVDVKPYQGYSLGNVSLGYNPETGRVYVSSTSGLNSFGRKMNYQVGDQLLSVNGRPVPQDDLQQYFDSVKETMREGEPLVVEVYRNGISMQLEAPIEKVTLHEDAVLEVLPSATPEQLKLRDQWMQGATRT